ncbi:UNVERIFIED_CONTAM: hypothetical protein Sradi_2103900 [Sesamum radiatum]|uniref:Uncharacterized protein n=1 Tax=Sesamum radiatum TaxID=300843 RepID=A0AAW2TIT3_SESRA
MPIKSESGTPPPRIGKIGPYTVFVTPPATPSPSPSPKPESPRTPVQFQAQTPVQQPVHLPSLPRLWPRPRSSTKRSLLLLPSSGTRLPRFRMVSFRDSLFLIISVKC